MFLSQLGPDQRETAISQLGTQQFDILVIGGGVNGVGAALDAAARGLKVALIESQDIAAGTSSRSSKLIHGGLRYLEQYDFKLVREALHERELMVSTLCPHLVKPVGFLFPLTEKLKERTYVGAGLALYDALRGFRRSMPWHKHLSQKQINEIAPSLRHDLVTGAIKYFDAQVDDARHTMSVARTAARHGAHIVMPGSAIKSDAGIIVKTSVSVLFIIPWAGKWIVGTTDTPYEGDRAEPLASKDDVQYILDQANRVLKPKLKAKEIIGVYAGLRPLVANNKSATTTKLSREHTVDRPVAGFVSIAGGKYTTYRVMAKDVIDRAVIELRRLTKESVTEKLPLVGADGYFALEQQKERIAQESGLDVETVTHLLNRHGSLISEILGIIQEQPKLAAKLDADLPYIKAEIIYAATHEGALSVDDVISRRTRLSFEATNHAVYLAEDVAALIAPVLEWNAQDRKESIAQYVGLVEREKAALDQLLEVNS